MSNMSPLSKSVHFKVFILFLILSVILTYPLALNMDHVAGMDDYVFVHAFWWFKKALFSLQNPFFTDFIFFPEGTSLVFHSTTFSNFLLTLPVSITFGVNAAVNTAYILTIILSGYTAFLLAYDLTENRSASVIAGLIFAFSPFHLLQGRNHLHISTLQWIPLYFLMLKRTTERTEAKWPISAGLIMGVIILTDQMQTICVSLITAISIPLLLFWKREGFSFKRVFTTFPIIVTVAAAVSSIYLYPAIKEILNSSKSTEWDPLAHGGANMFSGDLLGYFVPPTSHPLWGNLFASYSPGGDSALFFGYLPLLLAVIGLLKFFSKGIVKFVALVSFTFWILSLGTYLHVNGVWKWNGSSYPLPFLFFTGFPLIGDIRTPCRFHMITMLGLSLLAAYGVKWVLDNTDKLGTKTSILSTFIIATIILIEFLPAPTPVGATPVPEIYKIMAKDEDTYTVLELPLARWSAKYRNGTGNPAILMYYQTVHGKKIMNGHVSRATGETISFKNPVLGVLVQLTSEDNFRIARQKREPTESEYAEAYQMASRLSMMREYLFKHYKIKYIVIHNPLTVNTLSRVFVEAFTGKKMIYVPNDGVAYIKVD